MFKKWALILLFLSTPAYAGTISLSTISPDSTATTFNNNFTTLANLGNGNVEGSTDGGTTVANIKADSVYEINMADDANPRLRDSELFNIGADSVTGGTLTQATVVESGCVPADDSDLTSDVSACVAYVNGYRVSKSATSITYTANRDCYVDLSQTGVYTNTCVTNGAAQPSVAANSTRLAKVVTNGTEISTVTSLYTTRVPGLIIPANYRNGLRISKDSTTTITVLPGSCEVNNSMLQKTSTTTLTTSTAGDWAGGSSLRAANTYGFVGIDSSGNLKLHTTAPTNDDYAVSATGGKKRYATWSSTVYRILGWFYMDGAQNVENASNIKEGDVSNSITSSDTTSLAFTSTTFTDVAGVNFYNSGGEILVSSTISGDTTGGGTDVFATQLFRAATVVNGAGAGQSASTAGQTLAPAFTFLHTNRPQGTSAYTVRARTASNTVNLRGRNVVVSEQ